MLNEFENRILDFIHSRRLLGDADKLLAAVSGGADSIALLHVLCKLRDEGKISSEFICAHLNHKLRGDESDADENFVISQACDLGVKIVTRRLDVGHYAAGQKLSIETAGRNWRIETLCEIAKNNSCNRVVTGHHKNDNAETVIQRFLRGTGFRGLAGIRPKINFQNGACFVRPLLCVTRDEIQEYLKSQNLRWREDSSNVSIEYRRNFIRHHLLGEIQKDCSRPAVELLWELSCRMRKFQDFVEQQAEPFWQQYAKVSTGRIEFDLEVFNSQPQPIKIELILRALMELGSGLGDFTEGLFKAIIDNSNKNVSNRILQLPNGLAVWREYKNLIFTKQKMKSQTTTEAAEPEIPGETRFGKFVIDAGIADLDKNEMEKFKKEKSVLVEWFDYDKLKLPLTVRFRIAGDRFVPLGTSREKKVGKFLTDARVPRDIRKNILIVSDTEKIIWLWPIRISDQAKITEQTSTLLQLAIGPVNY
jgi:tRNA(Ile)-lysidine synthase